MVAVWMGNGSVIDFRSRAATMSEGTPREAKEDWRGGMAAFVRQEKGTSCAEVVACRQVGAPGRPKASASGAGEPLTALPAVVRVSPCRRLPDGAG